VERRREAADGVDGTAGERRCLFKSSRFLALFSLLAGTLFARCLSVVFCFLFRAIAARLHAVRTNK
jgi:hypothetical protein